MNFYKTLLPLFLIIFVLATADLCFSMCNWADAEMRGAVRVVGQESNSTGQYPKEIIVTETGGLISGAHSCTGNPTTYVWGKASVYCCSNRTWFAVAGHMMYALDPDFTVVNETGGPLIIVDSYDEFPESCDPIDKEKALGPPHLNPDCQTAMQN